MYTHEYQVLRFLPHPKYTAGNSNDIAIIFTKSIIAMSKGVFPICLPNPKQLSVYSNIVFQFIKTTNQNNEFVSFCLKRISTYDDQYLSIYGWGSIAFGYPRSDLLLQTTVSGFSIEKCKKYYPDIDTNLNMCTISYEGKDACQVR